MTWAILWHLEKDPTLFEFFSKMIQDQLNNQFIEKVPASETGNPCHYIPYYISRKIQQLPQLGSCTTVMSILEWDLL